MTIHPSLSTKETGKRVRSVLKRFERLKELLEKEKWQSGDSVFGLPKLKAVRWKIKKTKKAVEEGAAEATAAEAAAGAKAGPQKAGTQEEKKAAPKSAKKE